MASAIELKQLRAPFTCFVTSEKMTKVEIDQMNKYEVLVPAYNKLKTLLMNSLIDGLSNRYICKMDIIRYKDRYIVRNDMQIAFEI